MVIKFIDGTEVPLDYQEKVSKLIKEHLDTEERLLAAGYTIDDLEASNPFNQWMITE